MSYPVALPYDQPTKLSAWEIPFAVAGALVDCLTCRLRCAGSPPRSEEPYWPSPALPTYTASRASPPGGSYETKAIFTDIPLREEAIRRGFIQPEHGESPYTTLYTPPLGPPVRLVPVEAAAAASSILPQYALQQSFDVESPSLADAAVQVDMNAARAAAAAQEKAFVTAAATPSTPVAVLPSYFNCELSSAATPAARKNVLNSPHETVRVMLQQQGGIPLQSNVLQAQGKTGAYQGSYVSPVIPRAFEVYFPNAPYWRQTLEQKQYVVAAPPSVVSQAVDTVVEKEEKRDTGKKSSDLVSGSDMANSEKAPSPINQTVIEGSGSTDNLLGGKRKAEGEVSEKEIQADGNEGRTSQAGEGKEEKNVAGKGNGGDEQKTTPVGATVEQQPPQTPVFPTVEGITKGVDVSDQDVFHQKQSEYAPGGNRCLVGFVPPVPPQRYMEINVGGHTYLQGGVFYLSETGAYLLGV